MAEAKEEDLHKRNVKSLIQEHGNSINPEFIEKTYAEELTRHKSATVRQFVPLLVMREVKKALSQQYLKTEGLD